MTQDRWTEVRSKVEGLGLKLKLHLEQEDDDADERRSGSTKENLENLGERIEDAFEAFGNAANDPAVRADVKDIGLLLKDALRQTFTEAGAEVGESLRTASDCVASMRKPYRANPSFARARDNFMVAGLTFSLTRRLNVSW